MRKLNRSTGTAYKPYAYQDQCMDNFKRSNNWEDLTKAMSYGRYGQTYLSAPPTKADSSALLQQVQTVQQFTKAASLAKDVYDFFSLKDIDRIPLVLEQVKETVAKIVALAQPYVHNSVQRLTAIFEELYPSLKSMIQVLSENRRQISLENARQKIDEAIGLLKRCWNQLYPLAKECISNIMKRVGEDKGRALTKIGQLDSTFGRMLQALSKLEVGKLIPIAGQLASGADLYAKQSTFEQIPTPENQQQYDKAIYDFFISLVSGLIVECLFYAITVVTCVFGTIVLCILLAGLIGYGLYDYYKTQTDVNYENALVKSAYQKLGSPTNALADLIVELSNQSDRFADWLQRLFTEFVAWLSKKRDEATRAVVKKWEEVKQSDGDRVRQASDVVRKVEDDFINTPFGQQLGDLFLDTVQ